MKTNFIFLFLLLIFVTSLASAVSFSPTDLRFNLKPNEEECQKVTITSESDIITLSDSWAESKDQNWSVSGFKSEASLHDISIDYPSELSADEREFEVCLSGGTLGEYHGVLVLKEEQVGNSIIQMGIWIKVIISKTGKISVTPVSDTTTTTSGGSGSSVKATELSDADLKAEEAALKAQEAKVGIVVKEVQEEDKNSGITGSVIGSGNSFTFNWNRILMGFIVAAIGVVAVVSFRKKYRRNY